ncbi:MAG: N-acetylneuraminate synthase [Gammaproteobacteria bacterium]|nr:N-acetylneuraminate synthase [Gammaproteobacteria bacterium]MCH9763213.1 N-acetylneuraminate synthase [Gammaproteobacteria bacterium]
MTNYVPSTYIIAEAGVNHNGQLDLALQLIDAAAEAGADAIKFQTFKADKLTSVNLKKAAYQKKNTGVDESQHEMLAALEMPESWHHTLKKHAAACGIDFLSTAFDEESLALLQALDLPYYKISSGELTNAPLLWRFSKLNKPLILSTGMGTLSEVEQALAVIAHGFSMEQAPKNMDEVWEHWSQLGIRQQLKEKVTLLHCTSQYPTPWHEVNLRAMDTLTQAFDMAVGYSDHTVGTCMSIAAVARGACMIEKHITLDCSLPGPDHMASIMPAELKDMVSNIRALECALGDGVKRPQVSERDTMAAARQSIVAARPLEAGKVIESADLTTRRMGGGMSPEKLWGLIGATCAKSYILGEVFSE